MNYLAKMNIIHRFDNQVHEQGLILFRDLAARNVLITTEGGTKTKYVAKVADFGLSCRTEHTLYVPSEIS
jgi:serine/threonine protein kinase